MGKSPANSTSNSNVRGERWFKCDRAWVVLLVKIDRVWRNPTECIPRWEKAHCSCAGKPLSGTLGATSESRSFALLDSESSTIRSADVRISNKLSPNHCEKSLELQRVRRAVTVCHAPSPTVCGNNIRTSQLFALTWRLTNCLRKRTVRHYYKRVCKYEFVFLKLHTFWYFLIQPYWMTSSFTEKLYSTTTSTFWPALGSALFLARGATLHYRNSVQWSP